MLEIAISLSCADMNTIVLKGEIFLSATRATWHQFCCMNFKSAVLLGYGKSIQNILNIQNKIYCLKQAPIGRAKAGCLRYLVTE